MGLLNAPAVFAAAAPTTTSNPQTCSAPLITRLCEYKEPDVEFAVAEDTPGCWEYCHNNPPCDFAIFKVGNPYTGQGTCWLYPGEQFDPSQGKADGCGDKLVYVYGKPQCSGGSGSGNTSGGGKPTPTSEYTCAATESPSAIASICGYPEPGGNCFDGCVASSGASDCLSICAKSESCDVVIFNPHNPDDSPYSDGSCWKLPKYDPKLSKTCKGKPEQFVYENKCPKPPHPPSATKTSGSKATNAPGSSGGSGGSNSGGSGNAGASGSAGATASGKPGAVTNNQSMASGLSANYALAIGIAALVLQAL